MKKFFKYDLSAKEKTILMMCMVMLGVLLAMQTRTVYTNRKLEEESKREEIDGYVKKIGEMQEEIRVLKSDITTLNDKYALYLKDLQQNEPVIYSRLKALTEELNRTKVFAGVTNVKGAGIEIRMDDGDYMIVHDNYLYEIVNELKSAGAQAISVNDKRVVSMTEFRCIGPSIRINNVGMFPPYVIKAIGDPVSLEKKLKDTDIYRTIISNNLRFDISKKDNIYINKYSEDYYDKISILVEIE